MKYLLLPGLICTLAVSGLAQEKRSVAVAAKVSGKVELKVEGGNYQSGMKRGTQLKDKNWVRTLENGYLAVMFIDDKSLLKLREDSELEIRANIRAGAIDKMVQMNFGRVKAEISPQRRGEFTIATPTSVASVKGTTFWIISTPEGDQVIGIDGEVTLTNNESGQTVTVTVGTTATSNPDGTIDVQPTAAGTIPEDPAAGESFDELRIRLENADGETKDIIIEY